MFVSLSVQGGHVQGHGLRRYMAPETPVQSPTLGPYSILRTEPPCTYVSLQLRVQNAVSAQPCVGKLRISLVLFNFLDCNFRL